MSLISIVLRCLLEFFLLEEADPSLQETLKTENDPDPLNGEQTWPYQEEMEDHSSELLKDDVETNDSDKKKSLRKEGSEFQAAWIKDDESIDEESDEEDNSSNSEGYEDMVDDESDEVENAINDDGNEMESVGVPESEIDDRHYDKKVSFADEEEDLKRIKGKFILASILSNYFYCSSIDVKMQMLAKMNFSRMKSTPHVKCLQRCAFRSTVVFILFELRHGIRKKTYRWTIHVLFNLKISNEPKNEY